MENLPFGWGNPHHSRGEFLTSTRPVGVVLTPSPDLGRFPAVVFFSGGGGIVVPEYVAGALTGIPQAQRKAAGYVKRWIAKLELSAQEAITNTGVALWGRGSGSFAAAVAREKIRDYHPSMENPAPVEAVDLGPADQGLPWLHIAALSLPEGKDLGAYLDELSPETAWIGAGARSATIRDLLATRGAESADVFEFGEGPNAFVYGVVKFSGEGALVVPAALIARSSLPRLPEKYGVQARRYGELSLSWIHDGVYSVRSGWRAEDQTSVTEVIRRPPANSAYFRLLRYAPIRNKQWRDGWKHGFAGEGADDVAIE